MAHSIIPDLQLLVPALPRPAHGRVGMSLPVWGRATPAYAFASPPASVLPIPPRLLRRPQLLTRSSLQPLGEASVRSTGPLDWQRPHPELSKFSQIPPDLVVKWQAIDITNVIFSLIWRRHLVQT